MIAGVVLAAGLSRRAGSVDKLVARVRGERMVWHPVRAALTAGLSPVIVVTGAETGAHAAVETFMASMKGDGPARSAVRRIDNPRPEEGIASSIGVAVSVLGPETNAAVILLGDMPWVRPDTVGALVRAFRARPEGAYVPVQGGRRGNPVLWSADFFPALSSLEGDQGARRLLMHPATPVQEVVVDDPGIHRDVDTPEELGRLDEAD